MTSYVIGKSLTGIFEALTFFIIFEAVFKRRESLPRWIYFACSIFLGIIFNIAYYAFFGSIMNIAVMYFAAVMFSACYKGDLKTKTLMPLILLVIDGCIEIVVLYLTGVVFKISGEEVVANQVLWLLGAMSSKVFLLIVANLIRIRYKNRKLLLKTSYWILFIVVFAPAIAVAFLVFRLVYNINDYFIQSCAIMGFIGLMASAFASMYLYEHLSEQAEIVNREQQYKQQIKSQSKHLDEILVMQGQIKKFRHDISHHWVALRGYFLNGDCDGGIEYIDEISGALENRETVDTGNIALDAIISTKKALAEERQIKFESTVQIPEQLPIDAADICVIFGNALDNAIEACEKVGLADKKIRLSVIYESETTICKISNSIEKGKKVTFKTEKNDRDNHGFGLENIKHTLSKYNHVLKLDQTENEFILSFVIFGK